MGSEKHAIYYIKPIKKDKFLVRFSSASVSYMKIRSSIVITRYKSFLSIINDIMKTDPPRMDWATYSLGESRKIHVFMYNIF